MRIIQFKTETDAKYNRSSYKVVIEAGEVGDVGGFVTSGGNNVIIVVEDQETANIRAENLRQFKKEAYESRIEKRPAEEIEEKPWNVFDMEEGKGGQA